MIAGFCFLLATDPFGDRSNQLIAASATIKKRSHHKDRQGMYKSNCMNRGLFPAKAKDLMEHYPHQGPKREVSRSRSFIKLDSNHQKPLVSPGRVFHHCRPTGLILELLPSSHSRHQGWYNKIWGARVFLRRCPKMVGGFKATPTGKPGDLCGVNPFDSVARLFSGFGLPKIAQRCSFCLYPDNHQQSGKKPKNRSRPAEL